MNNFNFLDMAQTYTAEDEPAPVMRSLDMMAMGSGEEFHANEPEPVYRSLALDMAQLSPPSALTRSSAVTGKYAAGFEMFPGEHDEFEASIPSRNLAEQKSALFAGKLVTTDLEIVPPTLSSDFIVDQHHFYTNATTTDAVQAISEALKEVSAVVTKFNENKFKFSCQTCTDGRVLEFVVRLYSTPSGPAPLLVEFQRRSGCCLSWRSLWSSVSSSLSAIASVECGVCPQAVSQAPMDISERRACPMPAMVEPVVELEELPVPDASMIEQLNDAMDILADLASGECDMMRREACCALAALTANPSTARALAETGVYQSLLPLVASNDTATRCAAAAAVFNVASAAAALPNASELVAPLLQLLTGSNIIEQRASAQALAELNGTSRSAAAELSRAGSEVYSLMSGNIDEEVRAHLTALVC